MNPRAVWKYEGDKDCQVPVQFPETAGIFNDDKKFAKVMFLVVGVPELSTIGIRSVDPIEVFDGKPEMVISAKVIAGIVSNANNMVMSVFFMFMVLLLFLDHLRSL